MASHQSLASFWRQTNIKISRDLGTPNGPRREGEGGELVWLFAREGWLVVGLWGLVVSDTWPWPLSIVLQGVNKTRDGCKGLTAITLRPLLSFNTVIQLISDAGPCDGQQCWLCRPASSSFVLQSQARSFLASLIIHGVAKTHGSA